MDEISKFEDRNIVITNKRITVEGKTYPVKQIISVEMTTIAPDRSWEGDGGCIGIIFGSAFASFLGTALCSAFTGINVPDEMITPVWVVGTIILIILFTIIHISQKPTYILRLGIASGGVDVMNSSDDTYVRKLVEIISDVIVE